MAKLTTCLQKKQTFKEHFLKTPKNLYNFYFTIVIRLLTFAFLTRK